ncbi:MAG: hypothetical protein EOO27_22295, partial [Comamonadaceae bacterium]
SSAAWVNDNIFDNVISRIDTVNSGVAGTRNVQILPFSTAISADSWPNNNVFIKPLIEGDAPEFHLEIAGTDNKFISPRMEVTGANTPRVRYVGHASVAKTNRNAIEGGFAPGDIVYTYSGIVWGNGMSSPGRNVMDTTGTRPILAMRHSAGLNNPYLMFFAPSGDALNASNSSADYTARFTGNSASFKAAGDAFPKLVLTFGSSDIAFGPGSIAADKSINGANNGLRISSSVLPSVDNTYAFGSTALRWTTLYAATGAINTSDERSKQDIESIPDEVLDAWEEVNFVQYRWTESVERKGAAARKHAGLIAQSIHSAFQSRGLDGFAYGLLCFDEWEAEDGKEGNADVPAGSAWGIRADQCLFMEACLNRRERARLESRIRLLEQGGAQ